MFHHKACRQCAKPFDGHRNARFCSTECKREYQREYQRQYQLQWYYKLRDQARAKLGGVCVDCGTTEDLEIHHTDGQGADDREKRSTNGVLRAIVAGEPGFQLLCHAHHRARPVDRPATYRVGSRA